MPSFEIIGWCILIGLPFLLVMIYEIRHSLKEEQVEPAQWYVKVRILDPLGKWCEHAVYMPGNQKAALKFAKKWAHRLVPNGSTYEIKVVSLGIKPPVKPKREWRQERGCMKCNIPVPMVGECCPRCGGTFVTGTKPTLSLTWTYQVEWVEPTINKKWWNPFTWNPQGHWEPCPVKHSQSK